MNRRLSSSRTRRTAVSGLIAFWLLAGAASGAGLGVLGRQTNVEHGRGGLRRTLPPLPQVSVPSPGGVPTVPLPQLLPTTSAPARTTTTTTTRVRRAPTSATGRRAPTNSRPAQQNAIRRPIPVGLPPARQTPHARSHQKRAVRISASRPTPPSHAARRPPKQPSKPASGRQSPLDRIGRVIPLPLPVPDWSKPIIAFLVLLAGGFGLRARLAARRVRRLADDVDTMQLALVPAIPSRLGDLHVSVAYHPADGPAAGGDFYDVFETDHKRVAVILGDVSGHGRTALANATHMRYTLRAYVEAGLEPRAALKLAGQVFAAEEDDLFSTVAIAVYDAATATLTYASAGHPPPLTRGTPPHDTLQGCASPPLGWGAQTGQRQTTIPFPRGARACFFSDGLTEARGQDGMLGRDGLAELFAECVELEPSAVALLERVQRHAREVHDDMAACIIEAADGAPRLETPLEELEVDLNDMHDQATRFLTACRVAPQEIPDILATARLVITTHRTALLRVEIGATSSTATVTGSTTTPANPTSLMPAPLRTGQREAHTLAANRRIPAQRLASDV